MIKLLPSDQIDKNAWDACVTKDEEGLVYALSWYLDVVAPGWEGLVKEDDGKYLMVMPLPERKLLKFNVITQPLLTQQFGLFGPNPNNKPELLNYFCSIKKPLEQYNLRVKDFDLVNSNLPLGKRQNFVLPLSTNYASIREGFHMNRLRDLSKARTSELQIKEGDYLEPGIVTLYEQYVLNHLPINVQMHVKIIIPALVRAASVRKLSWLVGVFLPNGEMVAGAVFLQFKNRLLYLLPASSAVGKKVGASTFLIDWICQQKAGSNLILDFEGSRIPGIARYYASFGAQPETYGLLTELNLTLPLKILFAFKKWLSGNKV